MKFKKIGTLFNDMPAWYGLAYYDWGNGQRPPGQVYYPIPINLFINYYLRLIRFFKETGAGESRPARWIFEILWEIKKPFKYPRGI